MHHIEFLDAEISDVERLIAQQVLRSPDARHLLTVPRRKHDLRRDVPRCDR